MIEGQRPRISRLVGSNFLSLGEDVSVELGDLTALVGTNSSGKSNVVAALAFIADALDNGLEHAVVSRRGFRALRRASAPARRAVKLRYELVDSGWEASYEFSLTPKGRDEYVVEKEAAWTTNHATSQPTRWGFSTRKGVLDQSTEWAPEVPIPSNDLLLRSYSGPPSFELLRDALTSVRSYAIYPPILREASKPSPALYLEREGRNWASAIRRVAGGHSGTLLRDALTRVTGDVVDVRIAQAGDNLAVEFRHVPDPDDAVARTKGSWFDAGRESDGTLRVAGILTALLQDPPLTMIAVEEPELTVHPGAIRLVLEFLRLASGASQVLFTTHSPELLDDLDPDEIRVVQRIGGTTSVAPIDLSQKRLVRDRLMSPGELMRTEGLSPALHER